MKPYKGREAVHAKALEMRAVGCTLKHISEELDVPVKTIHSWTRHVTTPEIVSTNRARFGTSNGSKKKPTKELSSRYWLKLRLIEEGTLEEVCSLCGLGPSWNGLSLTLQLDHINGSSNDNRPENLRLLCPNCHSQTETFAGRNKKEQDERNRTDRRTVEHSW